MQCLHGNVPRVILFMYNFKHTIVMLLHYLLLHLEPILFKFFKGLFLSTRQGVESLAVSVPGSNYCQAQVCYVDRARPRLGAHLLLSLPAWT